MEKETAIKQLMKLEKMAEEIRLAADGWDEDWKTLVATLMSARTTDKVTIPIAQSLFDRFDTLDNLSKAKESDISKIIRGVNFYKGKAKRIKLLAQILVKEYNGSVPHDFSKLIELPGVGRKTANVFLAEYGYGNIGVDTHVAWISKQLGWTKHDKQELIERDLKSIFPKRLWGKINWILVRFGQTYRSRKKKLDIIKEIIKKTSNVS